MNRIALLRTAALLLLPASLGLSSCDKSSSPSRLQIQPVDSVRLLSTAAGDHRLRWDQPAGPAPDRYVVYRSSDPITETNRWLAESTNTNATEARVTLEVDTGVQYFAVAPVTDNPARHGPLSDSFVVDTTQRVAWLESAADGDRGSSIVVANLEGDVVARRPVEDAAPSITWSPTATRIAYLEGDRIAFLPDGSDTDRSVSFLSMAPSVGVSSYRFDSSGTGFAILGRDLGSDHPPHLYRHTEGGVSTPVSLVRSEGTRVASFRWTDEGRRLTFLSNQSSVAGDQLFLETADVGGTAVNRPLAAAHTVIVAQWAPEQSAFAYLTVLSETDRLDLYRGRNEPANQPGLIASGTRTGDELLRWSPTGATLAVVMQTDDDKRANLHLYAGGSHTTPLGDTTEGESIGAIAWSPNGSALAVVVTSTDSSPRLLVVDVVGGGGTQSINDSLASGETVADVRWSPDGSKVAALVRGTTDRADVSTIADGRTTSLRQPSISAMAWAEDDRRLLALASGSLHVLDTESSTAREIGVAIDPDATITEFHVARVGWRPGPMFAAELPRGPRVGDDAGVDEDQ